MLVLNRVFGVCQPVLQRQHDINRVRVTNNYNLSGFCNLAARHFFFDMFLHLN